MEFRQRGTYNLPLHRPGLSCPSPLLRIEFNRRPRFQLKELKQCLKQFLLWSSVGA
jgi:hypothetical protein